MAFKKYSKLLFSSTAMGVRIPPCVHPVSHPGPKWSTAFSSTAMGVRIPPRSPWTKMEHRNLWRNSSWLIHWLLSRDSHAVAFGPSTFSQHHLGPLPELLGFEKWSKQRCVKTCAISRLKCEKESQSGRHKKRGSSSGTDLHLLYPEIQML